MLYKGSDKIRDEGSYGVYHGSDPIAAIYKGSELVYLFNKATTWQAGTSLAEYKVPSYVSKIRIDCVASKGNNGYSAGGNGGRVQCEMTVTPNQSLYITVGDIPSSAATPSYNAADIRTNNAGITDTTSLQSRLVVAGGGGSGATATRSGVGGAGGGVTGGTGGSVDYSGGGGGGTQSSGGAAGGSSMYFPTYGTAGGYPLGGSGAYGGSGGAGLYGGGGGSGGAYFDTNCGGGGGGSSYTNASLCSNVTHTQGYQNGNGYITITEIG